VSLEDGTSYDVRTSNAMCPMPQLSRMLLLHFLLATGSMDKTVKLWDLSNNQPSCAASKTPEAEAQRENYK
ncbi:WD-repeat protein-like protein, partial [Trifolium medium]|nr:WD-repeat protein-like protein [Trifolium medium]